MTIKGYQSQAKLDGMPCEYPTVSPQRLNQQGLDVNSHGTYQQYATDAAEAGSTTRKIVASAHSAVKGDLISFTSGANASYEAKVWKVETNAIYLGEDLPAAPAALDAFSILRHKAQVVASDGSITTSVASTATGSNQKKGKIAGSSLTGSYATLLALTFDAKIVQFFNSCDNTILISLDGGTTDAFELEPGDSPSMDLGANYLKIANGVNISAKHAGAAPVNGTIRCSAVG